MALDPEEVPLPRIAHVSDSRRIEEITHRTLAGEYDLMPIEEWWRDQSDILLRRGYKVRRRYRNGWVPSWLGRDLDPSYCEDSLTPLTEKVLDAIRVRDRLRVCIKKIRQSDRGIQMLSYLCSNNRLQEPDNCTVPMLDAFDSTDPDIKLLVMPYLCHFDGPEFLSIDEVFDFMNQTLLGLNYLHKNRVYHLDLGEANIMMSGEQLFPNGHHPSSPYLDLVCCSPAKIITRRDVAASNPVKYYFIDFEVSQRVDDSVSDPKELLCFGSDDDLPELQYTEPYDPFPVDVFMLGNVYKKKLVQRYKNLRFLKPLVLKMTRQNPNDRLTATEALSLFRSLVKKQSWITRRWRVQEVWETNSQSLLLDLLFLAREEVVVRLWSE